MKTLLETVRSGGEDIRSAALSNYRREQAVDRHHSRVDQAVDAALQGITLRELCLGESSQDALSPGSAAADQAIAPEAVSGH